MTKFKQIAASLLMVGALFTTAAFNAAPAEAAPRFRISIGAPAPVVYTAPVYPAYDVPVCGPNVVVNTAPEYPVYSQWVGNWASYVSQPVYVRHDRPFRVYRHR